MNSIEKSWEVLCALVMRFFEVLVHFDQHIHHWVSAFGIWIYFITFLIILCETGIVLLPFLPGDSLLFALGAVAASSDSLHVSYLAPILILAAILGGILNYQIGKYIGPKIFQKEDSKWLQKSHLLKTHAFYEKHGGKTIMLARFIPIFRTFVPFVAGIGEMNYRRFMIFNIFGAIFWIIVLLAAGSFFGNIPIVKRNFGIVVPAIIIISVLPIIFELCNKKFKKQGSE